MGERFDHRLTSASLSSLIRVIEKLLIEKGMAATQRQLMNESDEQSIITAEAGGMINVIPSSANGQTICCNLALAIAHGSRGPGGLCQVLQQVRSHLIYCADARRGLATKTVLVIYDKEDNRVFWENKRDFIAHVDHNGVMFVRLFWDGKRLYERAILK
jgi:hypothetical protein